MWQGHVLGNGHTSLSSDPTLPNGLFVVSLASLLQLGSQMSQYKVKYKEPPFLKGGMLSPTILKIIIKKMLGVGGCG